MTLDAVVVGGGLGGLSAALALHRAGINVRVYEQAPELTEVGAGVALAVNGLRMASSLGIGEKAEKAGVRHMTQQVSLHDGSPATYTADQFPRPGGSVGIHRADLLRLLADELPPGTIHTGHRATGFHQDDGSATVTFDNGTTNGTTATADVVIGADGIHSVLQGFVVKPSKPVFSGVVAYRGLIPRLTGWPEDGLRIWFGEGRHFLVFPVRGGQLLNYVGFVPSTTKVRASWSAESDPAVLAEHFAGWDPAIQDVIHAISQPGGTGFQWGMYDREPLPRWTNGRLTLLGDAAHPMLPHLGQGVNQALEDAVTLGILLPTASQQRHQRQQGIPEVLAAYERLRRDRTARVQAGSRRNGIAYDSSGRQLIDMSWLYTYDVEAKAREAARALLQGTTGLQEVTGE